MGFPDKTCRHQDSQSVHGTSDTQTATVQDVSVDHRRSYIFVSEELLHSTDVISIFKKMSGKRVTKCMAGSPLGHSRSLHGPFEGFL